MLSILLLASSLVSVRSAVASDEVTSLPGWTGPLPSKHYSGYFPTTIDGSSSRMLHYWLTLSEGSPASDPVVLWLQGGPGCSSLFGLLYENGQIHVDGNEDSQGVPTLVQNPSAWTKVANMIWLEQPIGVGFSYCIPGVKGACSGTDFALDAYHFLINFFKGYPEFAKLPFHITGESYAGVYVPHIADAILTGNEGGGLNPKINLKGLAVGNGLGGGTNDWSMQRRQLDFYYGKGSVSYTAMQFFWQLCGISGFMNRTCTDMISQMCSTANVGPMYSYDVGHHMMFIHPPRSPRRPSFDLPSIPHQFQCYLCSVYVCRCTTRVRMTSTICPSTGSLSMEALWANGVELMLRYWLPSARFARSII